MSVHRLPQIINALKHMLHGWAPGPTRDLVRMGVEEIERLNHELAEANATIVNLKRELSSARAQMGRE